MDNNRKIDMLEEDFFVFNRNKDKRLNKIIKNEKLLIGSMLYETWLGADIVFERDENQYWNFKIYRRTRGTSLEIMLVIIAFISIRRRTNCWYKQMSKPFEIVARDFLLELNIKASKEIETAEDILYTIRNSIDYAFETKYALENKYFSVEEVSSLTKYYQQISMSVEMAFQFLASMAALRQLGHDVAEFNNLLISKKKYEMLQIVDAIQDNLLINAVSIQKIKEIFKIMHPKIESIKKGAFEISDIINSKKMGIKKNYHIALSFAGEDREIAQKIADNLINSGYEVFYDDYEKADLWGKDLYEHLNDLYSTRSKYCLMIISKSYADKLWTNHERKAAQTRAFKQNKEYILPLRLDETTIPAINDTIGYIDYNKTPFNELISLIKQKLNS